MPHLDARPRCKQTLPLSRVWCVTSHAGVVQTRELASFFSARSDVRGEMTPVAPSLAVPANCPRAPCQISGGIEGDGGVRTVPKPPSPTRAIPPSLEILFWDARRWFVLDARHALNSFVSAPPALSRSLHAQVSGISTDAKEKSTPRTSPRPPPIQTESGKRQDPPWIGVPFFHHTSNPHNVRPCCREWTPSARSRRPVRML